MHELSICQAMLSQVEEIAQREKASEVTRIVIRIGPLSGVVPELLQQAYTVARAGTIADEAELVTESQPIVVKCLECGAESEVETNNMLCRSCSSYRTQVMSGDELLLASVELNRLDEAEEEPA
jgi:hydrogenase nickel incorporation protein HypA/HybF